MNLQCDTLFTRLRKLLAAVSCTQYTPGCDPYDLSEPNNDTQYIAYAQEIQISKCIAVYMQEFSFLLFFLLSWYIVRLHVCIMQIGISIKSAH